MAKSHCRTNAALSYDTTIFDVDFVLLFVVKTMRKRKGYRRRRRFITFGGDDISKTMK